jgi:hypothetical protein
MTATMTPRTSRHVTFSASSQAGRHSTKLYWNGPGQAAARPTAVWAADRRSPTRLGSPDRDGLGPPLRGDAQIAAAFKAAAQVRSGGDPQASPSAQLRCAAIIQFCVHTGRRRMTLTWHERMGLAHG